MNSIEKTAKSISEAVELGASALGVGLDEVGYEVLDEGSKGFLGLGARLAKVKVYILGTENEVESPAPVKVKEKKTEPKAEKIKAEKKPEKKADKAVEKIVEKTEVNSNGAEVKPMVTDEDGRASERQALTDEDKAKIIMTAKDFLAQVFSTMNIKVDIEVELIDNKQLIINMNGDEMGVIIGKRGQTLDSLQYLVNLVVNKGEYPYLNVTLDTESYRQRRKETLETLAFNLAKKAKHMKKNVVLEPMNPYERRIIHSTLQNDRYVTTYSEGVEPYRYVVIAPKSNNR